MRKLALLIASGALAVAVLGSTAPSAQAYCFTKKHPSDPSWVTICDRERWAICDDQADGHYTWARFYPHRNPTWLSTPEDSYGRNSKGEYCFHFRSGYPLVDILRVCVSYEGCGPWRNAGGNDRLKREPERQGWFRLG